MREPFYSGSFYPSTRTECERELSVLSRNAKATHDARAVISPHAGWLYSGETAANAFAALKKAPTIVLLSPSHSGARVPVATSAEDWRTPLGKIQLDCKLMSELVDSNAIAVDESAHEGEHAIEVLLPFVQHYFPKARFVPIVFADQSLDAALAVAGALCESQRGFSVVASSDFTHYEPSGEAREKDEELLRALFAMDGAAFYEAIRVTGATACGFAPIACALSWAKSAGAKLGELLHFSNSGDASGDYSRVVDYAAVAFR